jgi:hypothetical protein
MQKCTDQLWVGVECDLPAGHEGAHHRAASVEGAALSWRSSAVQPIVDRPSQRHLQPAMFSLRELAKG